MKVVLVPSSYPPNLGGVEAVAEHLAAGLAARGHVPLVITNRQPKSLPAHENLDGTAVRRVAMRVPQRSVRGVGGYLLRGRAARQTVIGAARDHGCELVNLHCVSSNARYALATARTLDVPLVVSLHGELSGDESRVYERDPALRRAWRRLLDHADLVTAPSRSTLDEAERFNGSPFAASRVVRNGVDLDVFGGLHAGARQRVVLAAGRLVPNKGFDLLVDAWQLLAPDLADVRLEIAGEGWGREDLRGRIASSPDAGRITLLGRLSRPELAARMRAAAAFVLPSRAEALGLVVLEAMAAGAPVIAAAVGGVPEIVEDGVTGLLFPSGDPVALADRLTHLLRDPAGAGGRAAAAHTLVGGLDWSTCVDAYVDAYASTHGAHP